MTDNLIKQIKELYMPNVMDDINAIIYQVEALQKKVRDLTEERDEAQVDQRLIEELWERRTDMTEMKKQIELLRKERDEARKTCCRLWQKEDSGYITVQRLAEDQGWNCYDKKETP